MKYQKTVPIFLILLSLQLSSCAKEQKTNKSKSTVKVNSVSVDKFNNPYCRFIEKNNPDLFKDNAFVYFEEEDIDLDGNKEALVVLGEIGKDYKEDASTTAIFLLRNENGIIKNLNYDFSSSFYTGDVKFISLNGKRQKFIYVEITNEMSMYGFTLDELINNQIKNFYFKDSPSGYGSNYLVDKDNDGKYDGYEEFRKKEDVLFYEITESYTFKNNGFQKAATHVEIPPEYPDTIEGLLLQYISLRSLQFDESIEVTKRLKLICKDPDASSIKFNSDWGYAYTKNYLDYDGKIEFQTDEETYVTTANFISDDKKKYQCEFELKEDYNNWQITKVTMIKDGE